MFNSGKRYITDKIQKSIDTSLQIIIWNIIDEANIKENLDGTQIFSLSPTSDGQQTLTHFSQNPNIYQTFTFLMSKPIYSKIYVVDNGNYELMMLDTEY